LLLAGLTALDASAQSPPAPVAPIATSATNHFTDNDDGTVTDSLTGLVWLKNANCAGVEKTWSDALAWVATLASGSCGLTDGSVAGQWRLPNRHELQSLIDYTRSNPALPAGHPFTGIQSDNYWSSTNAPNADNAWYVDLYGGGVLVFDKIYDYFVWPVRGGL
jgi:hypothetical protein